MPSVFFIGGPLDGELREVPDESIVDGKATLLGDAQRITGPGEPWLYAYRDHVYHIANGIARHESVSEEEVARMVQAWREAWAGKHLV